MTEEELRAIKRPRPQHASEFLKPAMNIPAQSIRLWSQTGKCPFCECIKYPNSNRSTYPIHVDNLIQYKRGKVNKKQGDTRMN